jgi:hypothetical protein
VNVQAQTAGRHEIASVIGNRVQPLGQAFAFGGWTIPAAGPREVAQALKSARSRPADDPRRVVATLAEVGRAGDWITEADMDLISARVGCARSYLGQSMQRLNDWLAALPDNVARVGTPTADGYRTATGLWQGGLTTTVVLAGDASALGPLALAHMMLGGARTVAKGSRFEPLAPVLFLRRLIELGLQVPDLLFIDTAQPDATALTARLIANTQQSVVYGSDATLKAIYGSAEVPMTHKRIAFLSGRSGAIVLDDADPDAAAAIVLRGVAEDRGNRCYSTKKVFVPEELCDAFVAAFVARAEALRRGPPEDPATDIGRLLPDSRRVTEARIGAAQVLYDREVLLLSVADDHPLLVEEMPYPVCALRPYGPHEDPVALFNRAARPTEAPSALAVSVIGADRARFEALAPAIGATKVLFNRATVDLDHATTHQGLTLFRELMRFKEICA